MNVCFEGERSLTHLMPMGRNQERGRRLRIWKRKKILKSGLLEHTQVLRTRTCMKALAYKEKKHQKGRMKEVSESDKLAGASYLTEVIFSVCHQLNRKTGE